MVKSDINTAAIRERFVNFEDVGSPTVSLILSMCEEIDRLRLKNNIKERSDTMAIPIALLVLIFIAWKVRKLA